MKIKITKKSDQTDIGVINLAKVAAVHSHPIEGLEIFSELSGTPAKFSDDLYDFHIIEIAMNGKASLVPATISEILTAYARISHHSRTRQGLFPVRHP